MVLPPEKWLEFNPGIVDRIPETEGAVQFLDSEKNVILILGTDNMHQALRGKLTSHTEAEIFLYDEDPMYTKKESELIPQSL